MLNFDSKISKPQFSCIAFIWVILMLTGCSSSDDPSPAPGPTPSTQCEEVAGTWQTTETEDTRNCGSGIIEVHRTYEVTQSGCDINVTIFGNSYAGSVNGNRAQWSGSFDDSGGITTANISLTINGSSVNGTSNWSWTDGADSCTGTSQISGSRNATRGAHLPAPAQLNASPVAAGRIDLDWNTPAAPSGIEGYHIYSDTYDFLLSASGPTASVTGLDASTQYCYLVSAYDAEGNVSDYSLAACATTPSESDAIDPPMEPANLTATAASEDRIELSWTPAATAAGVIDYIVYDERESQIRMVSSPSATIEGLKGSTFYCYSVSTVDKNGQESKKSTMACATTTREN